MKEYRQQTTQCEKTFYLDTLVLQLKHCWFFTSAVTFVMEHVPVLFLAHTNLLAENMCCPISGDEPEIELQHVTAEAREDLQSRLSVFRDAQLKKTGESTDITLYVDNDIATGFPYSLVDSIVCNAENIRTISDLEE